MGSGLRGKRARGMAEGLLKTDSAWRKGRSFLQACTPDQVIL